MLRAARRSRVLLIVLAVILGLLVVLRPTTAAAVVNSNSGSGYLSWQQDAATFSVVSKVTPSQIAPGEPVAVTIQEKQTILSSGDCAPGRLGTYRYAVQFANLDRLDPNGDHRYQWNPSASFSQVGVQVEAGREVVTDSILCDPRRSVVQRSTTYTIPGTETARLTPGCHQPRAPWLHSFIPGSTVGTLAAFSVGDSRCPFVQTITVTTAHQHSGVMTSLSGQETIEVTAPRVQEAVGQVCLRSTWKATVARAVSTGGVIWNGQPAGGISDYVVSVTRTAPVLGLSGASWTETVVELYCAPGATVARDRQLLVGAVGAAITKLAYQQTAEVYAPDGRLIAAVSLGAVSSTVKAGSVVSWSKSRTARFDVAV